MADTWVKLAVPDYRRLKTVAEQVLGNTASHPCLRSSADSASFPDTICWRTLPDATDPTTKINVYNGVLFSKSKGWSTLPAGDLERFVEDTNFTSVTLPAAGEDETCVYLVWACKLTADTGDDGTGDDGTGDAEAGDDGTGDAEAGDAEAGAEYPGGLSIVADSAALTALQDRCDYHAVIALIFWDSTNDCGYRIAQRISSPLFLDTVTVAGDADKAVEPEPERETSTALTQQESIITKNGSLQLFGFDPESDAATLGPGLLKLFTVEHKKDGKPELAAAGESDTIWLVAQRVNGDYRGIVYIPINSDEATDTHKPDGPECDQNQHPASGGGGEAGEDEAEDHPADEDEEHPGEGDNGGTDSGDFDHPASDDCYTTAY